MIPIARPLIGEEEKEALLRVLASGQLAQGPTVRQFEEAFARYCGAGEAVAVSSGTAALMIALAAHGVGPEDEVITTPFSFIATANAVLFAGGKPVFVDVSSDDGNIDIERLEERISAHTRAILPVHLYGHPCRIEEIKGIAEKRGLAVIEDACQAHGATVNGKKVGSFGTGCFSFYATKNITSGEGGMITTDDPHIAEAARLLRDHGQSSRYRHEVLAYNWRLTEMAAAIGLAQLSKLEEFIQRRRANARYLSEHLRSVITPGEGQGCRHVYHQYTVLVPERRDALWQYLRARGIGAEVYYPTPIHQQPLYRKLGYQERLPVAERLSREVLSLPVHPSLAPQELKAIVAAVNEFFEEGQ